VAAYRELIVVYLQAYPGSESQTSTGEQYVALIVLPF